MKTNLLRTPIFAIAFAFLALSAAPSARAATLYWDGATPAGAPGGGAGTWDNSLSGNTLNWDTSLTGNDVAWVNANNDTAVFLGTAGTVTLGTANTVGGLRFDTTGYGITATNTLSFGATDNTILFNNAITAATITGTVGGSGNVILSNVLSTTAGTLTFTGASATGWSGTTTINAGMTLATVSTVALTNKVLGSTIGGITLNGGTIQFTRDGNNNLDAINSSAIGVNGGGTFSVTSTNGGTSAIENIGTVTVNSGQMNFVQTANNANQLVLGGLSGGASTTSAVTFSANTSFANAKWVVTGAGGATTAGQIFAPWATTGTAANAQTDYAVFNASNEVGAAGITASAQSTWSTAYALGSNYTLTNAAGTASQLTATRRINTLRNTAGTAQNITSITSDVLTVTGSTYANGDVVTTGGTIPTGLAKETVYYVVNASGGATFQLAATPRGAAITGLTFAASSPLAGGIRLSSGNNLETYGILNGSATYLGIGGATGAGVLTTPTGGGNLFLTTGSGSIVINAPITDNGGAVTVVRNGTGGRMYLSGNNTFTGGLVVNAGASGSALQLSGTQSFTGGITLNGGGFGENSANATPFTLATTLNGNAITVNGPSHLVVEGTTASSITINSNAVLKLGAGNSALTVTGVVSGSGTLDVNANNYNATYSVSLTNSANIFSGNVIYTEGNGTRTLNVNSIGDAGKVIFGLGASSQTFALNSTATSGLTFGTSGRQFELAGANNVTHKISNNSAQAFTINSDLLVSGTGSRTLTLGGTGTGLSTFAGVISNGSLTSLSLTKIESGTWNITGNINITGTINLSSPTGTLKLSGTNAYGNIVQSGTVNPAGSVYFLGLQSLPSASSISVAHTGGSGGLDSFFFLDDAATPASRSGVNFSFSNSNASQNSLALFVGNNSVANGGTSSSTQTGSTIQLGNYTFTQAGSAVSGGNLAVSGANGYKLQFANLR